MSHAFLRHIAFVLLIALSLSATPAHAQSQSTTPLGAAEIESLLTTLEDPAAREKFVEQLRGLVEAPRTVVPQEPAIPDRLASRLLETLSEQVAGIGETILRATAAISDIPRLLGWLQQTLGDPAQRGRLVEILGKAMLVLGIGWLAEYAVVRLLVRPRRWIERRAASNDLLHIPYALLNSIVAAAPLLVFAAVAFGTLVLVEPSRTARLVALALVNAHLVTQAVAVIASALLSPYLPGLRLLPVSDETAAYAHVWTRRLVGFAIYGYFAAEAALLVGLPRGGHRSLLELLGISVALLAAVLVLQNRGGVAAMMTGRDSDTGAGLRGIRRLAATYWHLAALLYIAAVLAIWLAQPDEGFLFVVRATAVTGLALAGAHVAARLLKRGLGRLFRLSDEIRARFPALETRANRYLQIFNVVVTAGTYGCAAVFVLQAWGLRSIAWFETPLGQRISTSALSIGITLVAAAAIWEGINTVLERYAATAFGEGAGRGLARFRTVTTLVQRALIAVLALFVGLVVLSELGINIAPLLAGAGVVGLAVGLGAQTLVKNLIEGVSNIMEDTFAVGDVVQIGDRSGVVEAITMRMVRLRDYSGHVHTIPFSEIKTVTNMTRDFAFAVFDIGVGYGEDIDRVVAVLKTEAAALHADPGLGPFIIEDLEVAGVDRLGDSAVFIKARFRVAPASQQWNVMREFNRRIKIAFDREGIEIPFPQRTVHLKGEPETR